MVNFYLGESRKTNARPSITNCPKRDASSCETRCTTESSRVSRREIAASQLNGAQQCFERIVVRLANFPEEKGGESIAAVVLRDSISHRRLRCE